MKAKLAQNPHPFSMINVPPTAPKTGEELHRAWLKAVHDPKIVKFKEQLEDSERPPGDDKPNIF